MSKPTPNQEHTMQTQSTPTYAVGDVIAYQPFGGGERVVLVTCKDENIKNGCPGFDGDLIPADPNLPEGAGVWGYDDQITRVVRRNAEGA